MFSESYLAEWNLQSCLQSAWLMGRLHNLGWPSHYCSSHGGKASSNSSSRVTQHHQERLWLQGPHLCMPQIPTGLPSPRSAHYKYWRSRCLDSRQTTDTANIKGAVVQCRAGCILVRKDLKAWRGDSSYLSCLETSDWQGPGSTLHQHCSHPLETQQ